MAASGPLAGIRFLEIGSIGPGPFCAMVLADLGAERFAAVIGTRSRDQWCVDAAATDACVTPVLSSDEVADDPHLRSRGVFVQHGGMLQPAPAARFSRTPGALSHTAPLPGEHTTPVLREGGLTNAKSRPCAALTPSVTKEVAELEQIRLGATGLHVSRICLGMLTYGNDAKRAWVLDESAAEPIVRAAVEAGITFFDTADSYSGGASEIAAGRLLKKLLSRDEMVVGTKVYFNTTPGPNGRGLSRKHLLSAIDGSLQRLGMDYVDLYQVHRWDHDTSAEETMEVLHEIVRSGKARYIGASTMYAWEFAKAQRVAAANGWTQFVSMQNHYNLLYREEEREMIPQCIDQGVAVNPWSALARGLLAGTRTREGGGQTERSKDDPIADEFYGDLDQFWPVIERLREVAAERGVPPAQMAVAWLLHRPGVTAPILGATKIKHVTDAVAATELRLTDDEITRLEEPYRPLPVIGFEVQPGART